jgi:hypothetical protein
LLLKTLYSKAGRGWSACHVGRRYRSTSAPNQPS